MDNLFDLDDNQVELASRRRYEPESLPVDDYLPDPRQTAHHHPTPHPANKDNDGGDDEFNFDYLPSRRARSPDTPFDLGLDEEVTVSRKRTPRAKLDEDRLLGSDGIPKLRDEVSKHIKFRGRGHEVQDLGRFIELYQFWAHAMFPKAKFRDAVKMVIKVGKTKTMKAHRRRLITELLPRPENQDDNSGDDADGSGSREQNGQLDKDQAGNDGRIGKEQDLFMRDDEDFLPSDDEDDEPVRSKSNARPAQGPQGIANDIPDEMPVDEMDDMDDMDALEAMGVQV